MANHSIRLTAKQEAALAIVTAKANADAKQRDPLFVDETPDQYLDRMVLGIADDYVRQSDDEELMELTAAFRAANQAKRDAAKNALK